MSDQHDLRQSLAERIEDETGVDIDPDEHIAIEDGRATLTEAGAEALSIDEPPDPEGETGLQFWDRVADAVNSSLPKWARYEGYGTYALGAYVYTAAFGVLAAIFWINDVESVATVIGVSALIGLLVGDYYRKAAKKRVVCDQCGEPARGQNECPHCGGPTFMGDTA